MTDYLLRRFLMHPVLLQGFYLIKLRNCSLYDLLFCFPLVNVADFCLKVRCLLLSSFVLLRYCSMINSLISCLNVEKVGFLPC